MRNTKRFYAALFGILAAAATQGAEAKSIRLGAFDAERGGTFSLESDQEVGLKKAIKKAFPGSTILLRPKITASLTSEIDVLMLRVATGGFNAITPLTRAEQRTLLDFVRAGGAAVIFTDNANFSPDAPVANASLLSPFGLSTEGFVNGSQPASLLGSGNPIRSGAFGTVRTITTDFPGWFDTLGSSTRLGKLTANNEPAVAYLAPDDLGAGSGPVVFFSDTSMLLDSLRTEETTKAILNALDLAPAAP